MLLVEDDEDDYLITRDMLAAPGARRGSPSTGAPSISESLQAIREGNHDVYLIDYRLGAHTGLELVREGFATRPYAPVIMLTGEATYEMDLEATALGVTDYLVKQKLDPQILERSIRYAISHQQAIRELALSEERYSLAVRAANDGIWDWDLASGRIYFSPRWHAILGRAGGADSPTRIPAAWFDLVHSGDVLRLRGAIEAHVDGRTPHLQSEHRMRHADGTWRWVMTRGLAIRGVDGRPTRMAGSLSDITDRRIAQLRLQHDALHDTLTGLPNRTLFMDRVNQILQRAIRDPQTGCAVLFLDIDRFKLVNDSLSHAVGDNLLIALAGRVAAALRPGDTVARLGGDEFTVLLEDVVDARGCDRRRRPDPALARRGVRGRRQRAVRDRQHRHLAELARPGVGRPDAQRRHRHVRRQATRPLAQRGVRREHAPSRGRPPRPRDRAAPGGGVLAAGNSLPADHRSGQRQHLRPGGAGPLARRLAARVPERVHRDRRGDRRDRRARPAGAAPGSGDRSPAGDADGLVSDEVCMSVNLSGRQLDDPGLAEQVRAAINSAELPPNALKLEITESTLMQEIERTQHVFSEVCGSGVGLHLDDFGTGYSSLTALHRFPVDALKIDRSFVSTISSNGEESNDVIVRSTVALAHASGCR